MRFPRAFRRFLVGYLLLHLLAVALFVFTLTRITRNQMIRDAQTRMGTMTTMLANHVDRVEGGLGSPSLLDMNKQLGEETNSRFTLINTEGTVIADSVTELRDIGPHGTREEIVLAKANGSGFSERFSSTLNKPMMYLAKSYRSADSKEQAGFLRVAIPAVSINSAITNIQKLIWIFAIATSLLTALLMAFFSARSMEPLNLFSETARRIGDGDYRQDLSLRQQRDEWGELSQAFDQMQNEITQREERLTENSQRLEAVLSSMIEGVIGIDSVGSVMLANGAACKMLSLSLSELRGKKLLDIVRIPELRTAVENTQLNRTFSKTEFETHFEPKRRLKARVSVLTKEDGQQPPGAAVVFHDVTELRQLETMRQDFVANVSHELKTPLSSIKAYTETLKLGAIHDQDKNLHFVKRIESQAEQLENQILDLLELAKVESGKAAFVITDVSVNSACDASYHALMPLADENQVRLKLALSDEDLTIRADREAIETIIKNLLINAIHYTPTGGNVTIESMLDDTEVVINVIDTGIGIAADQQARVFERFYRVDRARSREKGGTGLGLAIVKHLTQAFDGRVTLESQVGKGCKFQVRMPAVLNEGDVH